jgi:hypothetical protein
LGVYHPTWISVGAQHIDLITPRDNSVSRHIIYARIGAKIVAWLIDDPVGETACTDVPRLPSDRSVGASALQPLGLGACLGSGDRLGRL